MPIGKQQRDHAVYVHVTPVHRAQVRVCLRSLDYFVDLAAASEYFDALVLFLLQEGLVVLEIYVRFRVDASDAEMGLGRLETFLVLKIAIRVLGYAAITVVGVGRGALRVGAYCGPGILLPKVSHIAGRAHLIRRSKASLGHHNV